MRFGTGLTNEVAYLKGLIAGQEVINPVGDANINNEQ